MAVANWSSGSAMVKAVLLPLILVLLAVSAGGSSAEDGPGAVAKSGGRFSEMTQVGRKLLNITIQPCGPGSAPNYNCSAILGPLTNNGTCCKDAQGYEACWDVGAFWLDKCGSCNTKCPLGKVCCSGVCVDLLTDNNNCGICGNKCQKSNCRWSLCGY